MCMFNIGQPVSSDTSFLKRNICHAGFSNLTGELCWLDSPRWSFCRPLVLIALHRSFTAGKLKILLVDQTVR